MTASTVVFPARLMTTIAELGSFLAREVAATPPPSRAGADVTPIPVATAKGAPDPR
jgi:hypothetical protein